VTLWGFGPWILLPAGLLAIPRELYEAARVDGATPGREFLYITLPQLRPTLMVVTTLQVIAGLKIFVPIYVLTSGGPANASLSLYFLVFQKINQYKLVYATTVGWSSPPSSPPSPSSLRWPSGCGATMREGRRGQGALVIALSLLIWNTREGLILPYVALFLPLAIWIMRGTFLTMPKELGQAARIDGASELRVFSRIYLPMARGGLATVVLRTFIQVWNEVLLASTLAVFMLLQRHYVRGVSEGAFAGF